MGYFDDLPNAAGLFDDLPNLNATPPLPAEPAPLPALGMPPVAPLLNTQPVPALPVDQPLSAAFGPLATAPAASPVDPELAATAAARFIYANPDANRHVEQRLAELMAPPVPDPAPQEPLSELLKRRGQQFVTGAAETVASVPEGVAVAKANADRAMQDHVSDQIGEQARQAKSYRDILDAGVSPMNGGPMTPQERAVYEQRYQEAALGMKNWVERIETEVKDADARGEFAAAQAIRDAVAGVVGVPDPSDESFWGKVFTGAGTTLPYLATALTGPLAIPAGGALGAAQGSAGQYKDAKQAGASEEDAIRAARLGGAVGTTEIIPIDRALNLLPPRVRQAVTSKIGKLVGDVAQGAGEEAVQEAGSQALNNLIAAGIYDPDRGWSEGVSESAIIGAILGGALGGAGSIIRGSEKDAAQPTPQEPEEEPDGGNERVAGQENPQVDAGLRNVEQEGREGDAPVPDGGRADSAEQQGIGNTQGRVADAGRTDEQPEHLNGAEPAPTEPAPADAAPVANPERRDTIYTPDNDPVDVEYRVVEADEVLTSDQQGYDQSAQPRNRAKNKNSEVQIEGIANNPIFRRLNRAPETDRGAPVIGQDGLVESGNGRVIGLRRAYERGTAEEYRKALEAEYPEAKGMRAPIVVASRLTDMNRTDFAYRSNKPATQAMSAVEEARAEARMFDRDVLDLYRGGELTSVANRPMLMAFIKRLPQADQNRLITPEGGLTADGARRVQAAMFYRAFEDHKLLSRMAESVDDDMKGISGVLTKLAPRVAQMRDEMERGQIAKEGDFIPALVEAIGQIANFRARGEDLSGFNAQADAFAEPLAEDVQDIMAAMFNPAGTRLASKAAVEKFIEKAVEGAMKQDTSTSDLPGVEAVPPKSSVEIVKNARKAAETDEDQTAFFDGSPDTRKGDGRGRAGGKRTADGGSRKADAGTLQDAKVGRRPPGKLSPTFTEFSYTSRPSVYSHAFRQAGIDPKDGRMMPVEDQLPIVAKAVEDRFGIKVELPTTTVVKKNLAGRKVAKDVPSLQLRKALDQLLNAYRQMQMLAHVMAVPEKAIGLPIDGKPLTLSLVSTNRLRGALGMFSYGNGKRTISIPDMSNSFAHEWGHALDHYLGHMADRPFLKGMLTRKMNKDGVIPPLSPRRAITDAFAHVLWSMYGGSNAMGHLILDLQVDSAQLGPDGKPTQKAQVARKVLTDIREGRTPPRQYWSVYFRSAAAYDAMVEGGGYFTDPAEMFARAFEAFVGKQVAAISDQPQAFLSKGEWAYSDMTDQRAAMTFPKGLDLDQFTLAMVNLQHAMSRINLHGPDAPASAPETHDVLSTKDLLKSMPDTLTAAEKREWARTLDIMADLPAITKDKARAVAVGLDTFHSQAIRTGAATMFAIADRQKNPAARQAFTSIAEAVGKRPGRGKLVTSVWEETVRRKANARMNKLDGAVRKYGKRLTKAKLNELKAALTDPDATVSDPAIKELAVDIRLVMDEIWYDLQDAGINVGYKSNYLPHVYDPDRATADPDGFRDAAAKVYDLMFQREIVENDDTEAQIADMNSIINGLRKATVAMPKDDRAPSPRITEDQEATIAAWRKARSNLTRLNKQLEKTDDPDAVQEKIAAQQEVVEELHGEILDFLKDAWAKYSAENWMVRMRVGELNDFGSIGPEGNFLKGRTLPNEAGVIMRKFMFDNPMEMLTEYAFAAAKKAEYARVFGADNSKLQNMLDAAEGASREDVEMMKAGVQAATGRVQGSGLGLQSFRTTVFSLGNVNLLPHAAWSSLAEPLSAGLRTGYARDSAKALAGFVVPLVRRKRYRDLKEISRAIGLVTPYTLDTLMENRLGADVIGKHWLQTVVSRSFIVNGLTPLTHYQRTAMMPVANAALLRHLRAYVEGKRGIYGAMRDAIDGEQKSFANGELNEIGIAEADRADLLKWMDSVGGMPHFDDLYGPDGQFHKAAELWSRAVYRMTTEIIQDPLKTDRQILANNPDHAAMYGIMSFIAAFTRNIIWRNIERGIKDTDSKGKVAAKVSLNIAAAALPFATLYMGQFLVGMLRDGLFYSDKLDEMEDDEAIEWLALRALDRTGVYGQLSPLVNLVNGVRYETDMTSLFTGPYLAHFSKNTQEVIAAFIGRNSENTNTAEHKAARAMYRQLVKPVALSLIAGVAPTGPVSGNVARAAYFALASRNTETDFADALAGERGAEHVGPPPWWEVGD